MRCISACLVVACALPTVLKAADDDLAEARRLLLSGKVQKLSLVAAGDAELHPDLHAELARLAFERGDYPSAGTHVEAALRQDADQLLARWIQGELFRTGGKLKEADEAYLGLIRFYNQHQAEIRGAESLRWIGLAAAQRARWNRLSDQFHFLVGELYPDALKFEPDYWPAHYESGLLFLEKYNQAGAAEAFNAALELNPNAAEVHVAVARLALLSREVDKAQASLMRAMEINPTLLAIHLALADLAWANFRPKEAAKLLEERVAGINPVSEAALGRLAACYVLLDGLPEEAEETRFGRLVDAVTARNAHAGEFFFTLAVWLKERHRRPEAERFFGEAIRRMPQLVGPQAELGMMSMDAGEEGKARGLLEGAFEADPFNVRVDNMLKVLDLLDEMQTLRTEHCVLRFDGEQDKLLARYVAPHLDAVYLELCDKFGYHPPGPPLVEIFNQAHGVSGQQWFSTRLLGLPYLGTVAASTGKIVGMVSPNEPKVPATFNWAQTLGHEMVHVITLQQTEFNVPHWYTEGLAVWTEGYPRSQQWNELLATRVPKGELFNLQTINFGFTRPGSSDDWHTAYCQAELYVEYMLEGRSPEVLRQLLDAYAENLTTSEAIERVFGISEEEFEQGYLEYLKKIAAGLSGLETPPSESFADALEAHGRDPDDPDLCARVAYGYLRRGAAEEALEAADQALKLAPKHQLATYVLARLHVQAGRIERATELLEAGVDPEAPEPHALDLLAGVRLRAGEFTEAARLYQLGARRHPHNLRWLQALARAYLKSGDDDQLAEVLARLARAEPDDLPIRKKLAQLALAKRDFAAAADWANQALGIDVTDADLHRLFAEAELGRHNYLKAIEELQAAVELAPNDADPRFSLARAYAEAGKPGEARRVLEAVLRIDPDHLDAAALLEKLEENAEP
jgi:tetratricopeptide (TPR) repeat protein